MARRRRTAIIVSRIFEKVRRRTIILKEEGDSYEAVPGFSRTTPFATFSEAGWYPRETRGEKAALGGRKWPNRASFICCGVSASGREEKWGGAQPEANLFAVHRFWEVAESRNEDQCLFCATLMALK